MRSRSALEQAVRIARHFSASCVLLSQDCGRYLVRRPIHAEMICELDHIVDRSLRQLAVDRHVLSWRAKERDWVNYFAHRHLIAQCSHDGPLTDPAQIGIEVGVPQPPGYIKLGVSRDLVIWANCGDTCFDGDWIPRKHPLAILEWKVHRPGHRNRKVCHERAYCGWQPSVLAYAIEIDGTRSPTQLTCSRFLGSTEDNHWLRLTLEVVALDPIG